MPKSMSQEKYMWLEDLSYSHVWNNREEVMNSENCICLSCGHYFKPQEIKQWYKNTHACCASDDCGLIGGVLGSASGLDLEDFEECFY